MTDGLRPRILFVGRGAPWQGGAGYLVRQQMFLAALQQLGEVTAAMFRLDSADVAGGTTAGGCVKVVALTPPRRQHPGKVASLWRDMTNGTPRALRDLSAGPARAEIAELKPESFDAVVVYRIDTAVWAGLLGRTNLLLDIDDPEHARIARRIKTLGETPDTRSQRDLQKLRQFERDAARHARAAFVCQQHDAERFDEPRPLVAPNAVPAPDQCPPYDPDPDSLLFVGNLDAGADSPNVEGLFWFCEKIWPYIQQARPQATLRIGGRCSAVVTQRLTGCPGVEWLGFVPDMAAAVRAAAVQLAPIRFGTGTRIKVLDALAQGGAIVSTTLGCEGLTVRDGEHVRLADTPEEFAAACVELLADTAQAERLGRAGFALLREHYSFAAAVPRLVEMIRPLLGTAGR